MYAVPLFEMFLGSFFKSERQSRNDKNDSDKNFKQFFVTFGGCLRT